MADNLDGEVRIGTEIDTSGIDKGVKNIEKSLNVLKNDTRIKYVAKTVQAATKAIKDTTTAYNAQIKAEKQLETAAKNNPYLDASSVKQLKNIAGELQKLGTVGDETLIPLMAQLASTGRTQAEIENIMSAALDVSASGLMSLDSAVTQLNATYSGNVGLMGRQISELKNLTKEELESGKAVEIVANKFKGVAEETAKATGSSEQLKNAWGDLREEIGAGFEKGLAPMRKFFTELVSGWADAKKAKREYEEAIAKPEEDQTLNDLELRLQHEKEVLDELKNGAVSATEAKKTLWETVKDSIFISQTGQSGLSANEITKANEATVKAQEDKITGLENEIKARKEQLALEQKENAETEKKRKAQEEENTRLADLQKTRNQLRDNYDETIRKAQAEIEQRRKLGESITEQEEAQQLLDVATQAYIDMMSDPAFIGNSGNFTHEVDARKQIADWTEKAAVDLKKISNMDFSSYDSFINSLTDNGNNPVSKQIQDTIYQLTMERRAWKDNAYEYERFTQRIEELEKLKTKALEEEHKKQKDDAKKASADMMSIINSYFSQFSQIASNLSNLMTTTATKEAEAENKKLQNSYTEGLLSYEEYCQKKKEVSRKLAQEEYKAKMWEWTASILTATANVAEGVTKAIAQGGVLGIITGSLVSAAGAVQLASLAANKPQPPAFKEGGVIGGVQGASYGNDNTMIKARTGEMVLNAIQQRELWNMATGSGKGGASVTMPVTVENNAGAGISTQLDQNGLRIIVDDLVNTSLQQGKYTQSLNINTNRSKGARYL